MESRKIILLSVLAAITYGIIHDQITARICLEYFTVAHPPMLVFRGTESPTLIGLYWGVVATWWVGAILGLGLALAARAGSRPKMTASQLLRPIGILLVVMFVLAVVAGVIAFYLAENGAIILLPRFANYIPAEQHVSFLIAGAAHLVSYISGAIGGIILCVWTWRRRRQLSPDKE